jgi:hypothetical protein
MAGDNRFPYRGGAEGVEQADALRAEKVRTIG